MSTNTQNAKKALRKEVKARLASLSEGEVSTQSQRAQHVILGLPQYKQASSISVYLSMPTGETRTDLVLRDALGSGKEVFVPYMYTPTSADPTSGRRRKVMDMLRLNSLLEFDGLEKDSWGIPTLSGENIEQRQNAFGGTGLSLVGEGTADRGEGGGLHLIIMPGVAFDAQMRRLGHGAGFYDGFISRCVANGMRKKPFLGATPSPADTKQS